MNTVSNLTTNKLAELIAQRHTCLVQMHKLGVKQAELVTMGEMGALLRLLSVKNQLIAALQATEQQLAPFHEQDPERRTWSSQAERERCARQAAECQTMLAEIMDMERHNELKMTERRDLVASQLQAAQSASTARRAYQVHQRQSSKPLAYDTDHSLTTQLDLQSEV
ncbi:MAG: flagellar export chaperone FlgN [Bythopirellula sp.]|nr:flagellar export chaperone FlgN [Bythopirellula sp.]